MKWIKWNINGAPDSVRMLEKICKTRFEDLKITNHDYYEDDCCSFMSIENCKYKHDISNMSNDKVCIFGDIELFNMLELCSKYGIPFHKKSLIQLYEKCGSVIFSQLNGEFTFILFDKLKKKLFLIVDSLGIKELFWSFSNGILDASTDLFLLKEVIELERQNPKYFKDFLKMGGTYTGKETPYTNVFRILPGSYVSINLVSNEIQENKYWDLSDVCMLTRYTTEEAYFEQFRHLLAEALDRRLLLEKNGVAMSGGLDSTTLFAISKKFVDKTDIIPISGIFTQLHDCDETQLIQQVCSMYGTTPKLVNCDDSGMLVNYPEQYPNSDEPQCPSLSSSFTMKILKYASQNNITNLIDGYAADYLLTGTPLVSADLMNHGKILQSLKHIKDTGRMYDESVYETIYKNLIRRKNEIDETMLNNVKNTLARIKTHNQRNIYTQIFHSRTFKLLDRTLAPKFNLSVRHPFLDKDLIEFVYAIPGEMLFQKAKDKYLIREGMKYYLPSDVLRKTQKTQHISLSFKGINEVWSKIFPEVEKYRQQRFSETDITKEKWIEMLQNFRSGKDFSNKIFTMLCLELWLAQR